jgi:LssY C-terminus
MSDIAPRLRMFPRWARIALGIVAAYLLVAYLILPQLGKEKALRHPDLRDGARLTHTASGLPGDPLNIALVGSEEDVIRALLAAGWRPADPLSFRSSVRIAVDTVLDKPDPDAPVSNLYLYGRKEDLAFEKPIGHSPRERNHVRFWRSEKMDDGRPIWMGSATHDIGVELSRTTAEVTHRISPDVDAERDLLLADLTKANRVLGTRWIDGFHQELQGRNGGGDPWHTDGRMAVVTLGAVPPPLRPGL